MTPAAGASDRRLIYTAAFVRALATGLVGVLLAIHLSRIGLTAARIGIVSGLGLAGAAFALLVVTLWGDRIGRRRALVLLSAIGCAGGLLLACAGRFPWLAAAAFLGMVNAMGRDRGAAPSLEQAILPALAPDTLRTRHFAWYNVLQDAGHALGGLAAAAPSLLETSAGVSPAASQRAVLVGYALLLGAAALLASRLSPAVESVRGPARLPVSPEGRSTIRRIAALFALDSLGGGFLTTALVTYYFLERYGASPAILAALVFGARALNAVSHLGAAWLSRRIGLVNTMVFTHVPSSLLLATIAFVPSFPVAAALFLLREGLVEMDVPTRQSYVMAIVRPEERVFASGVTHLVRMSAWAVGPFLAGALMDGVSLGTPLLIGAGLKIAYDASLYAAFRRVRPPEESAPPPPAGRASPA